MRVVVREGNGMVDDIVMDELDGSPVLEAVLGDALPALKKFHVKLRQEGEPRGIIGPRDTNILWERHILNSAAIVPFVREATARVGGKATVADIGSGGGFPGIVAAACLPDHAFTLIEPMERRVEWLNECIDLMGLGNVRIIRARAEEAIAAMNPRKNSRNRRGRDLPRGARGSQEHDDRASDDVSMELSHVVPVEVLRHESPFAVVTCRAVAPMTKLSGWTMPLVRSHGRLVALKGRSAQAEIDKAAKEIAKVGGVNPRACDAAVGPGLESTHVVVVDKR